MLLSLKSIMMKKGLQKQTFLVLNKYNLPFLLFVLSLVSNFH